MPHLQKNGNIIFQNGGHIFRVRDTSGFLTQTIPGFGSPWAVAFDSVTQNRVFVADRNGNIKVYHLDSGVIDTIPTGIGYQFSLDFDPAHNRLAVLGYGGDIKVYDAATLNLLQTYTGSVLPSAIGISYDPVTANDRLLVLSQGNGGAVQLFVLKASTLELQQTITYYNPGDGVNGFGLCFDPDITQNRIFASMTGNGGVRILDATTLGIIAINNTLASSTFLRVDRNLSYNRLGVASADRVYIYDKSTLGLKYSVMGFSGATGIDFDSNAAHNRFFVTDQASGTLSIITELVS